MLAHLFKAQMLRQLVLMPGKPISYTMQLPSAETPARSISSRTQLRLDLLLGSRIRGQMRLLLGSNRVKRTRAQAQLPLDLFRVNSIKERVLSRLDQMPDKRINNTILSLLVSVPAH